MAISSQSQEEADRTVMEWKLPFNVIGDPSNILIKEMNKRYVRRLCGGGGGNGVVV